MNTTKQIESILNQILSHQKSGFQQSVDVSNYSTNNNLININSNSPSLEKVIMDYYRSNNLSFISTNDGLRLIINFFRQINELYDDDIIQKNIKDFLISNKHNNLQSSIEFDDLYKKFSYLKESQLWENLDFLAKNQTGFSIVINPTINGKISNSYYMG